MRRTRKILTYSVVTVFLLMNFSVQIGRYFFPYDPEKTEAADEKKLIKAWTKEFLTSYAEKWDSNELISRAHPTLLAAMQEPGYDFKKELEPLHLLGKLKKDNCAMSNFAIGQDPPDRFAIANFSCSPQYANGTAMIVLEVRQDHLKTPWRITLFNVKVTSTNPYRFD